MKIFDENNKRFTFTKFSSFSYICISQRAWMMAVFSPTAEQGKSYQKFALCGPDLMRTQFSPVCPSGWLEYQLV